MRLDLRWVALHALHTTTLRVYTVVVDESETHGCGCAVSDRQPTMWEMTMSSYILSV